jgi:hypothetical protein
LLGGSKLKKKVKERQGSSTEKLMFLLTSSSFSSKMQCLISNDLKSLSAQGTQLLESHPLFALHNQTFGTPSPVPVHNHSSQQGDPCHPPSSLPPAALTPTSPTSTDWLDKRNPSSSSICDVENSYQQLLREVDITTYSSSSSSQERGPPQAHSAVALPVPRQHDYGYASHAVAPMNGTGSLTAENSIPIVLVSAAAGAGVATTHNNNNTNNNMHNKSSNCCHALTVIFSLCLSCCKHLIGGLAGEGLALCVSPAARKQMLVIPFALTSLSILYFFFFYNI